MVDKFTWQVILLFSIIFCDIMSRLEFSFIWPRYEKSLSLLSPGLGGGGIGNKKKSVTATYISKYHGLRGGLKKNGKFGPLAENF